MADRTYYRLVLPAALAPEAVRMAAIAFTAAPWGDDDVARLLAASRPDRTLCIDIPERSVGECREAADTVLGALRGQGADVAFTVTEDPKYEWLGTMCRYQPSRGMHEVDGDANAQAVLTDTTLTALIRGHADPATVLDRITATLGLDWRTPTAH